MNQNPTPEPGRQFAVPPPWAEPGAAPSPFFAIPTPSTSGEIVPSYSEMPETTPTTPQQPWPVSPQPGPVTDQRVEQGSAQHPQAPHHTQGHALAAPDSARLQRLCRRLRETHRCPGRCVLSGGRQDRTLGQVPDIR
jgi:hypothetical protein